MFVVRGLALLSFKAYLLSIDFLFQGCCSFVI